MTMKKLIGLRKDITNGKEWKYLIFYDIDNPSEGDFRDLVDLMESWNRSSYQKTSFIIYRTKNGLHMVGLTPMDAFYHGLKIDTLHRLIPEYYSGMIIRLSRKEGETQELLYYNLDYPCIPNLLQLYEKRFNYPIREIPEFTKDSWHLVFEKYWTKSV